ncbi:1-pyrroline-5-carboxylate dehydrogenase [Entophlyctis luteolus]|nr:1-pyrroline-5-carboxylate dehydrogenase [Entophlyctis luteolus]
MLTVRSAWLALRARCYSSALATPQLGRFRVPDIDNERMNNYSPNSLERTLLQSELANMRRSMPYEVPCEINGKQVFTGDIQSQVLPFDFSSVLANFHNADKDIAIAGALKVKPAWEAMPFNDRAAIFLKAADLLAHKYRHKLMAATMLGQGKNVWQAEIDAGAELIDFWRFNVQYAAEIYEQQPKQNAPMTWNRMEYRALEGFVVAYSPFNFTAIGGNLVSAPVLMGNVCLWKPSPGAIYSSHLVLEILKEAGLPDGVIQFVPGDAGIVSDVVFAHPEFAGLHFTGSTSIFKMLWKKIANNIDVYKSYPRLVGETGGKNMHFLHKSADAAHAALQTVRSAFEYNGQKCSACSRVYVPDNLWPEFQTVLLSETKKLKQGPVDDFTNFVSSVINMTSYEKIQNYLKDVSSGAIPHSTIICGGKTDGTVGYNIEPTVVLVTDPKAKPMVDELFGPVVTVFVYPADEYEKFLEIADGTSIYGLTGALFAQDREAIVIGSNKLRHAAGNFYINDKSTGAVVGEALINDENNRLEERVLQEQMTKLDPYFTEESATIFGSHEDNDGMGISPKQIAQQSYRTETAQAANAVGFNAHSVNPKDGHDFDTGEDKKFGFLGSFFGPKGKDHSRQHPSTLKQQPQQKLQQTQKPRHQANSDGKFGQSLPEGWAEATTRDGRIYYVDHIAKITTWTDPRTLAFEAKYRAKDQNGNIVELVYRGSSRSEVNFGGSQEHQTASQQKPQSSWEDPRKRAEERMKQRIRDMKG